MPGGITVFTNAAFRVGAGKQRALKEGQMLRDDGFLLNPDGTTEPVCDHLVLQKSTVVVFKDGSAVPLGSSLSLPDGTVIEPDGTYSRPNRRSRLVDGQMLKLDGTPLPGLDTISFRNGKVVVYKGAASITLSSANQILGMFDGTRVNAQGLVTFADGRTRQLAEGQTITVPGIRAGF